jgi:hypothetical protein
MLLTEKLSYMGCYEPLPDKPYQSDQNQGFLGNSFGWSLKSQADCLSSYMTSPAEWSNFFEWKSNVWMLPTFR